MKKHFVHYMYPGMIVSESRTLPIDEWNVETAIHMEPVNNFTAYGSYGFYFSTRGRGEDDLDSRMLERSHLYFFEGIVETLDDVRNNPIGRNVLLANMEMNNYRRVITPTRPRYNDEWTVPMENADVVLNEKRR